MRDLFGMLIKIPSQRRELFIAIHRNPSRLLLNLIVNCHCHGHLNLIFVQHMTIKEESTCAQQNHNNMNVWPQDT